jgi:hypothetical protein
MFRKDCWFLLFFEADATLPQQIARYMAVVSHLPVFSTISDLFATMEQAIGGVLVVLLNRLPLNPFAAQAQELPPHTTSQPGFAVANGNGAHTLGRSWCLILAI